MVPRGSGGGEEAEQRHERHWVPTGESGSSAPLLLPAQAHPLGHVAFWIPRSAQLLSPALEGFESQRLLKTEGDGKQGSLEEDMGWGARVQAAHFCSSPRQDQIVQASQHTPPVVWLLNSSELSEVSFVKK